MKPTTQGTLWAVSSVVLGSWLPLLYLYTHVSDDPFVWRSWSFVFQTLLLAPVILLVPATDKDWRQKAKRLLYYWGDTGEPVRVRNPLEVLRTPAFWMVVCFPLDLAVWVWAATLIDPLVVNTIFQLFVIGMVWMAARLGKKMSAGRRASPHVISGRYWALMVLSFFGAALVIWSETGEVGALNWFGVVLSLAGAATAVGTFWGSISTGHLMGWPGGNSHDLVWNATFAAVAGRILALPLALLGSAVFFPPTENSFEINWAMLGLLSLLGVSNAAGGLGYRYSLYVTSSLSVQRIMFFNPAFQMLWIWAFADVSIANPQALLLGTGIVLLANLGSQAQTKDPL